MSILPDKSLKNQISSTRPNIHNNTISIEIISTDKSYSYKYSCILYFSDHYHKE